MPKSLVLTLGHNASAIAIQNGQILGGYEEERFTNIKSDSAFPRQSIERLMHYFGNHFDDVSIGHWFTAGSVFNNKYLDLDFIKSISTDIYSIDAGLTHHDSHMLSTTAFGKYYGLPEDHMVLVADGFGTFGECISIYNRGLNNSCILLNRFFGYGKSLGMLYQYTTAYLGMKMHNHEYKMLGYEAHITEVLSASHIVCLNDIIANDAEKRVKSMFNEPIDKDMDPLVNKDALAAAQHEITNLLDGVLEQLELKDVSIFTKRVIIAYYVQNIVEAVIGSLVNLYKPQNLMVAGGLFYNVKLNHKLADMVDKFSVFPLAGDQGAGLGVYEANHRDLTWPGHLNWGHRDLTYVKGEGIVTVSNSFDAMGIMADELSKNGMVNIVRGSMEFGPRSLCNTATIAKPTMGMVETINVMNDRTTVMPMAPAMTYHQAQDFLTGTDRIVGSLEYMVVTRDIKHEYANSIRGGAHHYPMTSRHTCRPQIIKDDPLMIGLLEANGPLINTSFNYHGVPIAFDAKSIEYSHAMQRKFADIKTVVIK